MARFGSSAIPASLIPGGWGTEGGGGVISWIIDLPDYEIIIASGKTGGEGVIAKKSLISQK